MPFRTGTELNSKSPSEQISNDFMALSLGRYEELIAQRCRGIVSGKGRKPDARNNATQWVACKAMKSLEICSGGL